LRGFDEAYCYGLYGGALRGLIHLFKYAGVKPLAAHLARLIREGCPLDRRYDAVVPVPLHWRKRWERGYNQSELLAREIARHRGIPLVNAVRRRRATSTQAGLSHSARRRNVAGAFAVKDRGPIAGKRILLVDDVMTTGATASACGAALKAAGAASVTLLTIARVDRRIARTTIAGSDTAGVT
jgi:ComF family protein